MPDNLSVVIFTCNRPEDLRRCLGSVKRQTFTDFNILVIDNGNDRLSNEILKDYSVKVIKDPKKRLSYLFNLGFKSTTSEFIVYLADDVALENNWIQGAVESFGLHPQAAVVTGPLISPFKFTGEMHTLYTKASSNKLLSLAARFYDSFILEGKTFEPCILCESGSYTLGQGFEPNFREDREVDLATTSGMLIRRSAIQAISGFDENFIFNHADGDLFIRLKKKGYKIIYNPRIKAFHYNRLGPSRYPFFIGRDTAYFYLKDIRPRSMRGVFAALANIIILNFYWIYKAIQLKDLKQLKGIIGFVKGFFDYSITSFSKIIF